MSQQQLLMKMVTLQFPTAKKLWTFKMEIDSTDFEVNLKLRTITCECSDKHIKMAVELFDAKLLTNETAGKTA
jgi:hypothetical protein